jgi:predicted HTH transcriptional regulator
MKIVRDQISELIESPDKAKIREHLQNTLGETDNVDYKADFSNYSKLSKHILAIANTGGGLIIIGVDQNKKTGEINPIGLDKFTDKAEIFKGVQNYIPSYLEFDILDFEYKETEYEKLKGKKIQVLSIKYDEKYIPFISSKSGEGITENKIYIRKGTQSIEPSYGDLQKLINKRIETESINANTIGLDEHLKQLKILYGQISRYTYTNAWGDLAINIHQQFGGVKLINTEYPAEDYDKFIVSLIEIKKEIIRKLIRGTN